MLKMIMIVILLTPEIRISSLALKLRKHIPDTRVKVRATRSGIVSEIGANWVDIQRPLRCSR